MSGPDQVGRPGGLGSLLEIDDPDAAVRRLWRNAVLTTVVLAVGVAVVTRSGWQVFGLAASALLILLNFQGLLAGSNSLVGSARPTPGLFHLLFLAGRYVLLAIFLCGIVLIPGVGPIPVLLGLSVLVLAILLEAIVQLRAGERTQS